MLATASAQVCVPLGHSSLYFLFIFKFCGLLSKRAFERNLFVPDRTEDIWDRSPVNLLPNDVHSSATISSVLLKTVPLLQSPKRLSSQCFHCVGRPKRHRARTDGWGQSRWVDIDCTAAAAHSAETSRRRLLTRQDSGLGAARRPTGTRPPARIQRDAVRACNNGRQDVSGVGVIDVGRCCQVRIVLMLWYHRHHRGRPASLSNRCSRCRRSVIPTLRLCTQPLNYVRIINYTNLFCPRSDNRTTGERHIVRHFDYVWLQSLHNRGR